MVFQIIKSHLTNTLEHYIKLIENLKDCNNILEDSFYISKNQFKNYLKDVTNNKFIINVFKFNKSFYLTEYEYDKFSMFISLIIQHDSNMAHCNILKDSILKHVIDHTTKKYFNHNGNILLAIYYPNLSKYLNTNIGFGDIDKLITYDDAHIKQNNIAAYNIHLTAYKILNKLFEFNIIDYDHDSQKQTEIINNLESKFDKKFNDLFENTSDIIKELKQDLSIKNEKIRNLELEVHYLKSQSEKKVTIDYDAIKQKNKLLNNEFKRIYKLMKFNNE